MSEKYALLERINTPADLKNLSIPQLRKLSAELRQYIIETVSQTGGHLAPTLGVIELTVALHYVYDSPKDKLIWDVGHQAYAHKVLTGRREQLKTNRQYGGLSGFLKRSESEHDIFGAGHASTSISAGLGFAIARDLKKEDHHVVSIIGDGALTGGLAFEGLNNLGNLRTKMLVVLNDNEMSISPNVGAISRYLNKIVTNPLYNRVRDELWKVTGKLPAGSQTIRTGLRKLEESMKNLIVPGVLFDEMGLRYFGPVNGHDIEDLIETLQNIKTIQTPVILHILTKKGKGLDKAEADPVHFHGVSPEKKGTAKAVVEAPAYLKVFGETLMEMAEKDKRIVAVTAAMREGTGLVEYAKAYPNRYFDVGIAEGHAVTFAAGMTAHGMRPFVAIYSTFLQRAYDHLIHDVAIQHLPVVFVLDRAGLVGQDGPTHHGAFDLSYLVPIPDVVIAAPKDGNELRDLMQTALEYTDGPFFIRYPKASSESYDPARAGQPLSIGTWEVLEKGKNVALVAVGAMVAEARQAMQIMGEQGIQPGLVNARFVKPFDEKMLAELVTGYKHVFVISEGSPDGGLGQRIQAWAQNQKTKAKIHSLALPDRFVTHGGRGQLLAEVGLSAEEIAKRVLETVKA
ncbi:MAG: 1-deoxy-D-xylulose-5-phosphate synthase [Candidatus Marinimicrobia bacterium]|nr:1-deoxy-D-xylulose-5-phosphate synthase [Candidatus Neomarinimicrobiota bacterium]MCF7839590.1 1-deoxy-D-xylulose-5-phosphate synthase [Candidatus Neomarinimicrobiota bacterium]